MKQFNPIGADERTAAKLLCMKLDQFKQLVSDGHLPRPRHLGPYERWDVDELRRTLRGEAAMEQELNW